MNIEQNNTLVTMNGTYIQIEKGSFESDQKLIKLKIQEAFSIEDMVKAGLTTQSGGQALSSGGMIYINADSGYSVQLKKAIHVFIPTNNYNDEMSVYRGDKMKDSTINWIDPVPLVKNKKLQSGEQLFSANCKSCHDITHDMTGPALWNVQERRSKEWLYKFTRNSAQVISGTGKMSTSGFYSNHDTIRYETSGITYDAYAKCLYNQWNKTPMTAFATLSDSELEAIYTYIKKESNKHPEASLNHSSNCCDSCIKYKMNLQALSQERNRLLFENEQFFSIQITPPILPNSNLLQPTINILSVDSIFKNIDTSETTTKNQFIRTTNNRGEYYELNITATGWYNVDILLKNLPGIKDANLAVMIQTDVQVEFNTILVIPSCKAVLPGGKLEQDQMYGFYKKDGSIPLPIGDSCLILAFAESNGKILFGSSNFTASEKQLIKLVATESSTNNIQNLISSLRLNQFGINFKDSKHANEIRSTDQKIKENEKWKPENCKCNDLIYTRPDDEKIMQESK